MGETIRRVWFPIDVLISLVAELQDGVSVEMAAFGFEGVAGLPVFLGLASDSHRAQAQVAGTVLEMAADRFRSAVAQTPGIQAMLLRYIQALMVQMEQGAACNVRHALGERAARWLLEAHDRVRRDQFELTQDFLACMLGVTRPSVTLAVGIIQQAGFVAYHRGRVTILNRESLEGSACECYRIIARHINALLGGDAARLPPS